MIYKNMIDLSKVFRLTKTLLINVIYLFWMFIIITNLLFNEGCVKPGCESIIRAENINQ